MSISPTKAICQTLVDHGIKAKIIDIKLPKFKTSEIRQCIVVNSSVFLQVYKNFVFPAVTGCAYLQVNLEDEGSIEVLVSNIKNCSKYEFCSDCPVFGPRVQKDKALFKDVAMTAQEFGNTPQSLRARFIVTQENKHRWGKVSETPPQ